MSKIERNWRDWRDNNANNEVSPNGGIYSANGKKPLSSGASIANVSNAEFAARAASSSYKKNYTLNKLSDSKYDNLQYKNNSNGGNKMTLATAKSLSNKWYNSDEDSAEYNKKYRRIRDFATSANYSNSSNMIQRAQSQINLEAERSLGIEIIGGRINRLATSFARIIYKFGEDHFGADIEGDDFWCERLLVERVISRKNINHCKKSIDKDRIILMLDTSPSCSSESQFYAIIASIAANLGDIELYDAPNGRIVKAYSKRLKNFEYIYDVQDIINGAHEWSYLTNRNIILFTDDDSSIIVKKNACRNNIILMTSPDTRGSYYNDLRNKITWFKNICTPQDLINVAKKLK